MIRLLTGDCRALLATLPANSVHCCVTSPPYFGLRDYGTAQWEGGDAGCDHAPDKRGSRFATPVSSKQASNVGSGTASQRDCSCGARRIDRQIGLEATPEAYLATMVQVFRELRRVLRDDGTVWCNMGDGHKDKQLLMMPARLALALQADGWWLRSAITWCKANPMPESVQDRCVSATEMVYMLTKKPRYYFDQEAIRQNGANCRNWWLMPTYPFSGWAETSRQVRVAWDAGVDGMKRKASPDCPVHAGQPAQAPMASDDGHAVYPLGHTGRSDSRPAPSLLADYAPTAPPDRQESEGRSSDLLGLLHTPSATGRSSQSHRTDLAPETSFACSVSAQTADDTGRIPVSPLLSGSADRMPESNSEPGGSDGRPSAQTGDHSADMSSCSCEWYIEKTEKTSHFATFPPELAERCIRAGTSERGCCAQCGKPWVRTTDAEYSKRRPNAVTGRADGSGPSGWGTDNKPQLNKHVTTTGWEPGCQCYDHSRDNSPEAVASHSCNGDEGGRSQSDLAGVLPGTGCIRGSPESPQSETQDQMMPVPCTVLDPFSGAGTALLVADRLGRDAIGIDLSHAYVEMARERLTQDCPLFADISDAPVPEPPEDERMADLFAEVAE